VELESKERNRGAAGGHLPDETVHVAGFLIEGFSVLDLNVLVIVKLMFIHHRFLGLSKPDASVVLFHPGPK
jgi:hypothetical protein